MTACGLWNGTGWGPGGRLGLLAGAGLIPGSAPPAAVEAYLSIHQALAALDRLEVRGRDSAGLHLWSAATGSTATIPS